MHTKSIMNRNQYLLWPMGCLVHQHLTLKASFWIFSNNSRYSTIRICLSKYFSPMMTASWDFLSLKVSIILVAEFSGLSWPKLMKKCWNWSRIFVIFSFFWSNWDERVSRCWILLSIKSLCLLCPQSKVLGFQRIGLSGLGVMLILHTGSWIAKLYDFAEGSGTSNYFLWMRKMSIWGE